MRPGRPRAAATALALAAVVLGGGAAALRPDRGGDVGASAAACRPAIVVDGRLSCGDEAIGALVAACPDAVARHPAPRDGDDIDLATWCASGIAARLPAAELAALQVVIDVSTASVEDLTSLRGVGPVVAARIVEGRPYRSVDDLRRVRGIGPVTLTHIRPRVTVGARSRPSP